MDLGLRIDVCTESGLRYGVPALLRVLRRFELRATFFVAMGPDCSGRAVRRLWRQRGFARKMLRTGGLRMYGLRTVLAGTLLPAPLIAKRNADVLRAVHADGHELGIHSWQHVRWQDGLDGLGVEAIREDYTAAMAAYREIVGVAPRSTAAPAWLTSEEALSVVDSLPFDYASDCRGDGPFRPRLQTGIARVPQVPATLPTLDERLGVAGCTGAGFFQEVLAAVAGGRRHVFTAHAESEGRVWLSAFEGFLGRVGSEVAVVPLCEFLERTAVPVPTAAVVRGVVAGRAGEVSLQGG